MLKVLISSYTFRIEFRASFPSFKSARLPILRAGRETLLYLPKSVLRKQIGKGSGFYTLSIILISPDQMQKLNFKYRQKNRPTDVLTFSFMPPNLPSSNELGNVLISYSIAKKQAKKEKIPIRLELQKLTIHGLLHLFGYDHEKTTKEARQMFSLQNKIYSRIA